MLAASKSIPIIYGTNMSVGMNVVFSVVGKLGGSLFEYIQSLYAFFAPPFAAVSAARCSSILQGEGGSHIRQEAA